MPSITNRIRTLNNPVENFRTKLRESVMIKLGVTIILALILLIPTAMIESLISERQDTRAEAVAEISDKWGGEQTISGPVLTVPYRVHGIADSSGKVSPGRIEYASFLPADLKITGTLDPEIRYRGIFEAVLYTANLKFSGSFRPSFEEWAIDSADVIWKEATISLGIPDMKGIRE